MIILVILESNALFSVMIRSIELEPKLLDAYWHRHLLHLLQDNKKVRFSLRSLIIFLWSFR